MQDITLLLNQCSSGVENAPDKLLPLVYDELRRLAHSYLRKERSDHTLQPTALVHEAYIRLVDWQNAAWQDRAHFFAVAAQSMRRILIDYARQHRSEKRGGELQKIALDDVITFADEQEIDLLALDEALAQLESFDERQCRIVEMRFFGGLTIEETAEVMKLSPSTIKNEWLLTKTWLYSKLTGKI